MSCSRRFLDRARSSTFLFHATGGALALALLAPAPSSQAGVVLERQKISSVEGGFGGSLQNDDGFGMDVELLGDVDGDGDDDVAVGMRDQVPGGGEGAVWILFLNPDGTVEGEQKIDQTEGGFGGTIGSHAFFGASLATIGDLDGDGIAELAVAAPGWSVTDPPAVWILFLNADGTVRAEQKIAAGTGGFSGSIGFTFAEGIAALGDLDGDGVGDLAVGEWGAAGTSGAVWILFLNADGTVSSHVRISSGQSGFAGNPIIGGDFGSDVSALDDIDGDGVIELAVGAPNYSPATPNGGEVWVLFLNSDGTVHGATRIGSGIGGFTGSLGTSDFFGTSVEGLGDLDGDGVTDLCVGALGDQDGGVQAGAVWILLLNADGTVRAHQKISALEGNFFGALQAVDWFGRGLGSLGDLDADGFPELGVGVINDDDGGSDRGAVWILTLDHGGAVVFPVPGCGQNPDDSLVLLSGQPVIGTTLTLGVDNPVLSQSAGSIPFLALSLAPGPPPCGFLFPGFSMGPNPFGAFLIDLAPPNLLPPILVGPPWTPGVPAPFVLALPNDGSLLGTSVFLQGLLLDPPAALGVKFGLTQAFQLRLGD